MKKRKIVSMLLAGALLGTMVLGGCGNEKDTNTSAKGEKSAEKKDSKDSYLFVTNNFGAGAYPLDMMVQNEQAACNATGMELNITDNEFTVDKVITQLQSQLAMQPDGVAFLGISETLFPTAAKICEDANTPYVFYACSPTDEDMKKISENPNYCGMVIYSPTEEGERMAQMALDDGCKTAVISAGAAGDYAHDRRIDGFTETFEAGGGTVHAVAHSADPSEGVTKTSDLVTAYPDVDCIYGAGEDYITAAATVLDSASVKDCKIYGSNASPDVCTLIKEGKVEAVTGGEGVCGALALPLLINYLDGHPILDKDGNPPYFGEKSQYVITKETADQFYGFLKDHGTETITAEEYQNLLYRNNPDVDYDYYDEFLKNYETSVYEKVGVK
ncbi:ABC-type sugar transport system%2C periplasmic component [uncultured Roseburia sp.]|uniref:Sugar ABC transporter substrate-binding protein n=1 Tax=Brotonthovivens ammoniilytica TaxID=2981725 RepID=A0ABT2TFT4_9FIRM|nr:sugar ABC transporter substrate-binding protein [Brotonthovivens ammoniilytica]MCU6761063.1 sugar ABC transporter substrate-binding protein [Brotonthovivens ammoniilytica]SCI17785.1 ABC-type sugar transport system%2C periplasmic component [uncultured Roseburia sp.]